VRLQSSLTPLDGPDRAELVDQQAYDQVVQRWAERTNGRLRPARNE
jgi:hypothetical protein